MAPHQVGSSVELALLQESPVESQTPSVNETALTLGAKPFTRDGASGRLNSRECDESSFLDLCPICRQMRMDHPHRDCIAFAQVAR